MTDYEFEDLLERVAEAVAPMQLPSVDDEISFAALACHLPAPANDNGAAWPLLEFPAGWSASC